MATFHLHAKIHGRADGGGIVGKAAYRACVAIRDERQGISFDYTRKRGLAMAEILLPEIAPGWMQERGALWNAVEASEKRKDAQLAREFELALPLELTHDEQVELVRQWVRSELVSLGMAADVAIHEKAGNPHAHVLTTLRAVDVDGFSKKKPREWNDKSLLEKWRSGWSDAVNLALEKAEVPDRVTHLSYARQGLPQVGVNLPRAAYEMERRGERTVLGDLLYKRIEAAEQIQHEIEEVKHVIARAAARPEPKPETPWADPCLHWLSTGEWPWPDAEQPGLELPDVPEPEHQPGLEAPGFSLPRVDNGTPKPLVARPGRSGAESREHETDHPETPIEGRGVELAPQYEAALFLSSGAGSDSPDLLPEPIRPESAHPASPGRTTRGHEGGAAPDVESAGPGERRVAALSAGAGGRRPDSGGGVASSVAGSNGARPPVPGGSAADRVERLVVIAGAMGYEIEDELRAEPVPVIAEHLVAAEWPDEPAPARTTREALLCDLVERPFHSPGGPEIGKAFQSLKVDVETSGEVRPRVDLLSRAKVALHAAWKRVQALWGSRVPPPQIEPVSKPSGFVPDVSLPTGEIGWEPPENPGRPWPMGWPTPEETLARRAAKVETPKPAAPPVTAQEPPKPPRVGARKPKTQ